MKMRSMLGWVAAIAMLALCACGGGSAAGGNSETKLADQVTRAVYDNDISGVTQNFSADLTPQVTRASVGVLSDKMHDLGTYQGLTETAMDIPSRRYTFDAKFDKGDMTVGMRLDANGKILAYRVVPGTAH